MPVRATLTLDDDVKAKLDQEMRKSGKSFKEVVNDYLRIGLDAQARTNPPKPFVVPVSYTHLDVYKRQLQGRAAVLLVFLQQPALHHAAPIAECHLKKIGIDGVEILLLRGNRRKMCIRDSP